MKVSLLLLRVIGTLFAIFDIITKIHGFSSSVPPLRSVCKNMIPHHHDYKPKTTEAPYEVIISSGATTVAGGNDVIVTLNSTQPGTLFKGFYMQARDENSKPIGSFSPNDVAKTHSCAGVRSNAVHHANGKIEKEMASVTWTAPKDYVGEVIFIATFVKDFVTIWSGVYSNPVSVTPYVKRSRTSNTGENSEGGGLIGLIGALGIHIPGITPQNNPNRLNNANSFQQKREISTF